MKLSLLYTATVAGLAVAAPQSKRASSFRWFGANEAGAEFGYDDLPGELGTHYIWPDKAAMQTLRNEGMNIFRVAFMMERLVPDQMTGSPDPTYMGDLKSTVNAITDMGAHAVIDPHNFGRYYGNVITSTENFAAFWTTVASEFASNPKVIFDTNNEYHTMDQGLVLDLNQAAINAIRGVGATSQYIFAEGNSWTGAWTWTEVNDNMKKLTDPEDKLVYEMHQYLDSNGAGKTDQCVSQTIGKERVLDATQWLKDNNKKGFLGEFAGGANSVCKSAVEGMLGYMEENADVWLGGCWWSAGPWWADYIFSMEPPDGIAYNNYLSLLRQFFAGSSGGSNPTPTTTATSTPTSGNGNQGGSGGKAQRWEQCGGSGWTGPTQCVSPHTCQKLNEFYSQCQ
ncbi:fCBD [Aspergillus sp. HF37]|nr:fCBD [Aspergillus sp. HF37]